MPSDLWTEIDKKLGRKRAFLKFTRALCDTDWDRFDYYASMIRVMNFKTRILPEKGHPSENISVRLGVYTAFNLYASTHNRHSFLPRLHSARFVDDKDYPFTIPPLTQLVCFLSSKLMSLEFNVNHLSISQRVAKMIIQKSPNITYLAADLKENLYRFMFSVDPALSNLTSISGDLSVETQTGDYLGTLPLLKSVRSLTIDDPDKMSSFTTDGGRFPSLIELQIKASYSPKTAKLLGRLQRGFETLHIVTRHGFRDPNVSDLTDVLGSNSQLHTSLTKLIISTTNTNLMYLECSSRDDNPLYLLRALQHLVIEVSGINIWEFDDKWLAEGALAWPEIQSLVISTQNSYFTLEGLIPLIVNCRNITNLDLCPLTVAFDLSLLPRDGSGTNHKIKGTLSLGEAKASRVDPPAVFQCIKAMFPNVTDIALEQSGYRSTEESPFGQKWMELE
ncbi:hypothetical protein H0H93_011975, partial [Arthromyces matolae]